MGDIWEVIKKVKEVLPSKSVVKKNIANAELPIRSLIIQSYDMIIERDITADAHETIDIVLDKTWEDLNTGHWSSVPSFRRYIYSLMSLMMVLVKIQQASKIVIKEEQKSKLIEALNAADRGLLMGGELHKELTTIACCLTSEVDKSYEENSKNIVIASTTIPDFVGVHGDPIPDSTSPSLETFFSLYFNQRKPVKLKDCINHWSALKNWKDIGYLLKKAGSRTVPIEIGSRYDDSDWSQKLMDLRQFIEEYVLIKSNVKDKGYLAQHQLFNQVPELKEDIRVPEFCCCSDKNTEDVNDEEDSDEVDINAWFGPKGTVSPLHFDPKHNLLAQVVGRKRVILYDPKHSDSLYPYSDRLLFNTAQVDPEKPDFIKFPGFKNVSPLETILNPGEMLYIPPKWWHHVRSLDTSFSVSFWW